MAITARVVPRRARRTARSLNLLIVASVAAAVLAVLPIAAAVLTGVPGSPAPRTAFASAPDGAYVVVLAGSEREDIIRVVPAADPLAVIDIARVQHLPGYTSRGAASPDGRWLALVVVDAGSPALPGASLIVADLHTGELVRLAIEVDHLQAPLWTPDSTAVLVARSGGVSGGALTVRFSRVARDLSGESLGPSFSGVLGAYPVGFDASGALLTVVIDDRGSTVYRDESPLLALSPAITRDWRLSPDGTQLAFVEVSTAAGVRYSPRVASLNGGGLSPGLQAMALSGTQGLGVAWDPAAAAPRFGVEPAAALSAQSNGSGFDVPLAFSADGRGFVAMHWTGQSFAAAGQASLVIEHDGVRTTLPGTRFQGWVQVAR